jgi:hypothetical protein
VRISPLASQLRPLDNFDYRVVFDGAIAHGVALPAGQPVAIPLRLAIPADADPSHEYQLTATADIPGVPRRQVASGPAAAVDPHVGA